MTTRVVVEGVWGSNIDRFVKSLISEGRFDEVAFTQAPSPFFGIRGWTKSFNEGLNTWRKSYETESILYYRTVWSAYPYAKNFSSNEGLDKDERELFKSMTESVEELLELPDVIIYCHSTPKEAIKNLEQEDSICALLGEEKLKDISISMIEWLDDMKRKGVTILELPPQAPFMDYDTWYRFAIKEMIRLFTTDELFSTTFGEA